MGAGMGIQLEVAHGAAGVQSGKQRADEVLITRLSAAGRRLTVGLGESVRLE